MLVFCVVLAIAVELTLGWAYLRLASYLNPPQRLMSWLVLAMAVMAFIAGSLAERALP
jgi:hypothetical protein